MTDAGKMLKEAYLHTQECCDSGKKFPTRFVPIWDMIKTGYAFIEANPDVIDSYDMYTVCYHASIEYNKLPHARQISADDAFSTVICELGIYPESVKWYRLMAHYYLQQAERKELECMED